MSTYSNIEWTETTWNPVTGCSKISNGCKNCYAERMALRLQKMGAKKYNNGFSVAMHHFELESPSTWKKPRLVFVNSMSDLFHKEVPDHFIEKVFKVMNQHPQHTFQVLTKRPHRVICMNNRLCWTPNIWFGVSIESQRWIKRIDLLKQLDAHVKYLSLEPLLGPLPNLVVTDIDWVIVGGESGPGARPIKAVWVRDIRDQCNKNGIPFFFKQWGGVNKKKTGRTLDNREWNQMPLY